MNKDDGEKKSLILKFYNHGVQGKVSLFVSFLLSGFCALDIKLVCVVSVSLSIGRFSPVVFSLLLSKYNYCSVFGAL